MLDHLLFMNSKTLFKARAREGQAAPCRIPCLITLRYVTQFQRKDPVGKNRQPVMVHINYHPDKASAFGVMLCVASSSNGTVFAAVGAHEGCHPSLGGRRHTRAGRVSRAC